MYYLDPQGVYRASELDEFPWLIHGFGTRQSGVPDFPNLATLKQVHSAICMSASGRAGVIGQGDALIESTPGAVVAVKTADCVPILLIDPEGRSVAAVHAGWRGTAAKIAQAAAAGMGAPDRLHAAIGPGIGKCCYEVGPEVAAEFGEQGRTRLDLAEINRRQLIDVGVTPERIYASNLCTMCLAGEFHSFRRDRERSGRQYSFAGIRAEVQ